MNADRDLRNEYRAAWATFARALDELQRRIEAGERDRVPEALVALEKARLAHNQARDCLAARLGARLPAMDREETRVRKTARRLWELSGRPNGTAETDWTTAERLVRTASIGC